MRDIYRRFSFGGSGDGDRLLGTWRAEGACESCRKQSGVRLTENVVVWPAQHLGAKGASAAALRRLAHPALDSCPVRLSGAHGDEARSTSATPAEAELIPLEIISGLADGDARSFPARTLRPHSLS
ncbi:MAG: hypothetical protein ACREX3_01540 [Gammaproteobacteria bacterium]